MVKGEGDGGECGPGERRAPARALEAAEREARRRGDTGNEETPDETPTVVNAGGARARTAARLLAAVVGVKADVGADKMGRGRAVEGNAGGAKGSGEGPRDAGSGSNCALGKLTAGGSRDTDTLPLATEVVAMVVDAGERGAGRGPSRGE